MWKKEVDKYLPATLSTENSFFVGISKLEDETIILSRKVDTDYRSDASCLRLTKTSVTPTWRTEESQPFYWFTFTYYSLKVYYKIIISPNIQAMNLKHCMKILVWTSLCGKEKKKSTVNRKTKLQVYLSKCTTFFGLTRSSSSTRF